MELKDSFLTATIGGESVRLRLSMREARRAAERGSDVFSAQLAIEDAVTNLPKGEGPEAEAARARAIASSGVVLAALTLIYAGYLYERDESRDDFEARILPGEIGALLPVALSLITPPGKPELLSNEGKAGAGEPQAAAPA